MNKVTNIGMFLKDRLVRLLVKVSIYDLTMIQNASEKLSLPCTNINVAQSKNILKFAKEIFVIDL